MCQIQNTLAEETKREATTGKLDPRMCWLGSECGSSYSKAACCDQPGPLNQMKPVV